MATQFRQAFVELNEENKRTIAKFIYKYSDYKNKVAVKELLSIDIIKKTLKETTVMNYLTAVRKYLRYGKEEKSLAPSYIYKFVKELQDKHYARLTPPANCKVRVYPTKASEEVTEKQVVSTTKKEPNADLINAKNQLELRRVKIKSIMTRLQEREKEINDKLNAVNVVIELLN